MSASDETAKATRVLEHAARAFGLHSGPQSTDNERDAFGRDLRTAAIRYARAYAAEARELGLIPNVQRVDHDERCDYNNAALCARGLLHDFPVRCTCGVDEALAALNARAKAGGK